MRKEHSGCWFPKFVTGSTIFQGFSCAQESVKEETKNLLGSQGTKAESHLNPYRHSEPLETFVLEGRGVGESCLFPSPTDLRGGLDVTILGFPWGEGQRTLLQLRAHSK